jgi:transcriptional regulator with XRE-family HTH domain
MSGADLRDARRDREWTQAELAETAQVSVNYIGSLENGSTTPGVDLVDRLASALEIPLSPKLLLFHSQPPSPTRSLVCSPPPDNSL